MKLKKEDLPIGIVDIALNIVKYARQRGDYPDDTWIEINDWQGNVWDLNLWKTHTGGDVVDKAALYPVVVGDPFNTTDTSKWYELEI